MSTSVFKRLAREIWMNQVARGFSSQLTHHGWTWAQCRELAKNSAEFHQDDGEKYGWLFGRLRITPAEAVQGELECWTE